MKLGRLAWVAQWILFGLSLLAIVCVAFLGWLGAFEDYALLAVALTTLIAGTYLAPLVGVVAAIGWFFTKRRASLILSIVCAGWFGWALWAWSRMVFP